MGAVLASTPALAATLPRSTVDRPDDFPGYQIHVVYALPSDGVDEQLDTKGKIATSISLAQDWLREQTGGRTLRFDTYQAALDVSFLRLAIPGAQVPYPGYGPNERLLSAVLAAGFGASNKIYAIFYGGPSGNDRCGGGSIPPADLTKLAVVWCLSDYFDDPQYWTSYPDFTMIHEIFHTLGAVPSCAPHYDRLHPAHFADNPHDLMYWDTLELPITLDERHTDYYGHGRTDCLDVARSVFFDPPLAGATPPPGWPASLDAVPPATWPSGRVSLPVLDCSNEKTLCATSYNKLTTVQVINLTSHTVRVFWLDPQHHRQPFGGGAPLMVPPGLTRILYSYATDPLVAVDETGQCQGVFAGGVKPGQVVLQD
jgi:hypothetical protein